MSRTYRYRKGKDDFHVRDFRRLKSSYFYPTGKDRAENVTDGQKVSWWGFSPYIKTHSNTIRRSRERGIEKDALRYGDNDSHNGEKILKKLHWVYD